MATPVMASRQVCLIRDLTVVVLNSNINSPQTLHVITYLVAIIARQNEKNFRDDLSVSTFPLYSKTAILSANDLLITAMRAVIVEVMLCKRFKRLFRFQYHLILLSLQSVFPCIRNVLLTLNVRGPSYLGLTRSISRLLMPWLLTSPGHQ